MPIGTTCLLGHGDEVFALAAARAAPGSLSDASQFFQPDEGLRMGRQDAFADGVVGIQLEPSLSLAERDSAARGAASALQLEGVFAGGRNGPPSLVSPFPNRTGLDCPVLPP